MGEEQDCRQYLVHQLMTFGFDYQGDRESLTGPPEEVEQSLQVCMLKDIAGSVGRLWGGDVGRGAQ